MKIFKGEFKKNETWPMLRPCYDLATTLLRPTNDGGTTLLRPLLYAYVCSVHLIISIHLSIHPARGAGLLSKPQLYWRFSIE